MTYVYFAQAAQDGPIKIGFTGRDPRLRRTKLQTDCPWPVALLGAVPGDRSDESRLQSRVHQHRIHGDWFHSGADVLALVREQLAQPAAWRAPTKVCANPIEHIRRNVLRLTQGAFAAVAGASQATISRWENGELEPRRNELERIRAEALQRDLPWNDGWFFNVPDAPDIAPDGGQTQKVA